MEKNVLKIITVGHLNPASAEFLVRLQHQRQIRACLKHMKWNPGVSQAYGAVAIEFSGARVLPTITFILSYLCPFWQDLQQAEYCSLGILNNTNIAFVGEHNLICSWIWSVDQ